MNLMDLTKSQRLLYAITQRVGEVDDKVKLAKLAYFADFLHYAFYDQPISEPTNLYQRRNFGPLSISFNSDLKHLQDLGLLESPAPYHYKIKKDIDLKLDEKEIRAIDYVVDKYSGYSYDALANISHKQIPYISASEGGIIDYNTAYNLVEEYPDFPV